MRKFDYKKPECSSHQQGRIKSFKGVYHKKVQNADQQIWANFPISETKLTVLGLFPGILVFLGCISAIIEFDVLSIPWLFTSNVPLIKKPGCWLELTKCLKSTVGRVTFFK